MCELKFFGIVICFDEVKYVVDVVEVGWIKFGSVIVFCYLGFVVSGMLEVLVVLVVLVVFELDGKVVLVLDICVLGVLYGVIGVYCFFEVIVGGFIVLVEDGDVIFFDL